MSEVNGNGRLNSYFPMPVASNGNGKVKSAVVPVMRDLPVARKDLVEASRAVHDEILHKVKELVEQQAKTLREEFVKSLESLTNALKQMPTPNVTVQVPQPRLVKKHLQYDAMGRPVVIEEEEVT